MKFLKWRKTYMSEIWLKVECVKSINSDVSIYGRLESIVYNIGFEVSQLMGWKEDKYNYFTKIDV